jgi:hypothetical protein
MKLPYRRKKTQAELDLHLTLWDKIKLWRILKDKAMIEKLKSRKLWVTVITAAVVALSHQLGLDQDLTTKLVGLAAAYVLGQGMADINKPAA